MAKIEGAQPHGQYRPRQFARTADTEHDGRAHAEERRAYWAEARENAAARGEAKYADVCARMEKKWAEIAAAMPLKGAKRE